MYFSAVNSQYGTLQTWSMASGQLIIDGKILDGELKNKLRTYKRFEHFHYGGTRSIKLFY